jgi:hypothetical protein
MWRKDVDWMQLAQNWVQLRPFVNMIVEILILKNNGLLDLLNKYRLLMDDVVGCQFGEQDVFASPVSMLV